MPRRAWILGICLISASIGPVASCGDEFRAGEEGGDSEDGAGGDSGSAGDAGESGVGGNSSGSGGTPTGSGGTTGKGGSSSGTGGNSSSGTGGNRAGSGGSAENGGSTATGGSTSGTGGGSGTDGGGLGGSAPGGSAGAAVGGGAGGPSYARSCKELHANQPELPSGEYSLRPDGVATPFTAYCDMQTGGGGWTLTFNEGETFDQAAAGDAARGCFLENCTNRSYSTVLIELDVMMHAADEDIRDGNWLAQIIVRGIHAASRGRTLRGLMDAPGRFFLEAEDNSNLEVEVNAGGDPCDVLLRGFNALVCGTHVFAFSDTQDNNNCIDPGALEHKFALGGEVSYSERWYNCAGWPQHAINQGVSEMPKNFRFFVR